MSICLSTQSLDCTSSRHADSLPVFNLFNLRMIFGQFTIFTNYNSCIIYQFTLPFSKEFQRNKLPGNTSGNCNHFRFQWNSSGQV